MRVVIEGQEEFIKEAGYYQDVIGSKTNKIARVEFWLGGVEVVIEEMHIVFEDIKEDDAN